MYNFQGIWYRIVACGCVLLILGLWALAASKFWNHQHMDKKSFSTGCFVTGVSTFYIIYHIIALVSPEVLVCTGSLVESRRASRMAPPFPLTWEYVFDTGEPLKECFSLDTIFSKEIFPDGELELKEKHCIYYENRTKIIVKVDHLTK